MKVFSKNDFQILEKLIALNQKQVKNTVSTFLKKKDYTKVIETKDYIIAEGDIPIALVAHMDTVWETDIFHNRKDLFYDVRRGVMWNPWGAGFDDRAGIFAILKIIRDGFKPHVIFTTDEEKGGLGAVQLVDDIPDCPFNDLKYIIELDRANEADCVFYDCYNKEFIDYVERFGFIEAWGSFSDIDIICPEWETAGVNLSIGYKNEHTHSETLYVNALLSTILKVEEMFKDVDNAEHFVYILSPYSKYYSFTAHPTEDTFDFGFDYKTTIVKCKKCGQYIEEFNAIPVKNKDGGTSWRCCDCICDDSIEWCNYCGEAFEKDGKDKSLCNDCRDKIWKPGTKKSLKNKSKK